MIGCACGSTDGLGGAATERRLGSWIAAPLRTCHLDRAMVFEKGHDRRRSAHDLPLSPWPVPAGLPARGREGEQSGHPAARGRARSIPPTATPPSCLLFEGDAVQRGARRALGVVQPPSGVRRGVHRLRRAQRHAARPAHGQDRERAGVRRQGHRAGDRSARGARGHRRRRDGALHRRPRAATQHRPGGDRAREPRGARVLERRRGRAERGPEPAGGGAAHGHSHGRARSGAAIRGQARS